MNQVPHIKITETHWLAACKKFTTGHTIMDVCNKAIEIALAEANAETEPVEPTEPRATVVFGTNREQLLNQAVNKVLKPMSLAIVVEDVDAQLCRVDKISLNGGAPWITLEQKSHLCKESK